MKLSRKNLGRVATTFLATAMLASLTAVPAMAAGVNGSGSSAVSSIPVTKKILTDGNTFAPGTTFDFIIKPGTGIDEINDGENQMPVTTGPVGGLGSANEDDSYGFSIVAAPAGEDGTDTKAEYTFTGSITVNSTVFATANPGVYHYTVEEVTPTTGAVEGMIYDTTKYDVFVYVMQGEGTGNNYVGYVVTTEQNKPNEAGKSDLTFENNYGAGDNDTTHDVLIKKEVTGNQGDQVNGEFTFTIDVTPGSGATSEWYKVVVDKEGDGSDDQNLIVKSDDENTTQVTLKHNGTIRIYGLSASDTYEVIETVANQNGYTTTDTDKNTAEGTVKGSATADVVDNTPTHTVTNNRESSAPTGIAMDIAPYALLVVIAAAGCFVFLRKRNED